MPTYSKIHADDLDELLEEVNLKIQNHQADRLHSILRLVLEEPQFVAILEKD